MSLMKSLARVAAGVMLAKGLGTMIQNQQQSRGGHATGRRRTGGGILGDLMNAGSRRGGSGGRCGQQPGDLGGLDRHGRPRRTLGRRCGWVA